MLLIAAAHASGDVAAKFWKQSPETWDKDAGAGPVTEADIAIDRMLHSDLLAARPDYGWLSEETEDGDARQSHDHVFIIDPIDGTRAFIEGSKTFAHSLALSLDYHQTKQTGTLSRVIDRGARSTDFLIRSLIFNLGPTAVELVLAMIVMVVRLDWRFALTALVTLVIYAVVTFKITDWRLSHRRELNEADSRAAGLSVDALMNYETVKTFGAEGRVVGAYGAAMADYVDASSRANTSLNMLNGSALSPNASSAPSLPLAPELAPIFQVGRWPVSASFW